MNRRQKIENIIIGLVMIAGGLLIAASPEEGYLYVLFVLSLSLIVKGCGMIIYYLSMARLMVGGKRILYQGIIFLDLGLFAFALNDIKKGYIMFYLIVGMLFAGAVDVLRSLEQKKLEAPGWKFVFIHGLIEMLYPIAVLLFASDSVTMLVDAYVLGIIYSGIMRIVSSFRKTAMLEIPR